MADENFTFAISSSNWHQFVSHWAHRYRDKDRDVALYDPHIGVANLRDDWDALHDLFRWKNGSILSQKKRDSIRSNYFATWVDDASLEDRYLALNQSGGAIWNIFYLHCRRPHIYPIYDQHAHRGMQFVQTGRICEDLSKREKIFQSYKEYRLFVGRLQSQGFDLRQIDRALFTFGQFLKMAKRYS